MKQLKLGHLWITLLLDGYGWTLYLDWRMPEIGNRWRLQLEDPRSQMYIPLFSQPTRRGKHWAWWARGNERHSYL